MKFWVTRSSDIVHLQKNKIELLPQPCEEAVVCDQYPLRWVVNMELNAIPAFISKYGPIVIFSEKDGFEIEIYDDWRE